MKSLFIFTAFLAFSSAFGQDALRFKDLVWDFGSIEEGKTATYDFVCTNTGKDPVMIQSANASCGCTVSEYTRLPLLPGKSGKVTASYNTVGRPGSFTKTITVLSNGSRSGIVLTIRGTVIPRSQMPAVTPEQMAKSPLLEINKKSVTLGQLERDKPFSTELMIKNTGKTPLKISSVGSYCQCVNYKTGKSQVSPGDSTTLELTYKPRMTGTATEWVSIYSNDVRHPKVMLQLQANVVESLNQQSEVKEEKAKVPFR